MPIKGAAKGKYIYDDAACVQCIEELVSAALERCTR